ncbi:hypothetical protein HanHA300_Chr12g0437351 [Helianthus annuus]|nr:hypothetical protein HanHA300_Chr12g0437351 [Helianthus annuus]KAJ0504687.1 hypothetical protein HanHA89_Chr12g0462051 [Helianthus annuus]KAJ0674415.1 hypothetical protein HanLR1_Chr12g0439691 [Helianthus annuus]
MCYHQTQSVISPIAPEFTYKLEFLLQPDFTFKLVFPSRHTGGFSKYKTCITDISLCSVLFIVVMCVFLVFDIF